MTPICGNHDKMNVLFLQHATEKKITYRRW